MSTIHQEVEALRVRRMLRLLEAGQTVIGTGSAPARRVGKRAVVIDPHPPEVDGVRRVRVKWEGEHVATHVLPASISGPIR
jgi:hypothetical protein